VREMLADAQTRADLSGRDRVTIGRVAHSPPYRGVNPPIDG
jgi:hypothetical protein